MSLTRTETDACDLVQDTYVAWAEKGWQLQDRTKAPAWLFTTLHRRFLEKERRATRFEHFPLADAGDELPPIVSTVSDHLDAGRAVELLARLDPAYRAAVALYYLEEYSYEEIAGILDVPLGTVKSRIARGLARLKQLIRYPLTSRPEES
jgi:RNA polymerase sigma-70 factor (ECF subfamily)